VDIFAKSSYFRGLGNSMSCDPGLDQIGGLCYGECPSGWHKDSINCVQDACASTTSPGSEVRYTTFLLRQQVSSGPIPYAGMIPYAQTYGTAQWIRNPNSFAISFPKTGKNSSSCFDPDTSIGLAPGAALTSDQMKAIFGAEKPALPAQLVICINNGTNVPDSVPITTDYITR
jgi:hypothetical protein